MTRRRKGLRPISQTGFPRIPQNPKQRVPTEGGGKQPGRVLDAFNDRRETSILHPTKGWRNLNVKRSRAQMLIGSIHSGQHVSTKQMAEFLRNG